MAPERSAGSSGAYWEGVHSLLQYYRWIELNIKYFENYAIQKNNMITIVKNYKNSELTWADFSKLC